MSLNRLFERAIEVGQTVPTVNPRQRMSERAEELNRTGLMQSQLDVCVAAMVALVNALYQADADGIPANVDCVTGRILPPVPWGSRGYRRWKLRQWEATCLRRILIEQGKQRRVVLFDYNSETRQWYIDMNQFPTMGSALLWLKDNQPTLEEWRTVVTAYREREQARVGRRRHGYVYA